MIRDRATPAWLLLMLGLAAVSAWWQTRTALPPSRETADGTPDSVMEGYRATLMNEQGRPRHRLWGERLTHHPGDDSTALEQPRLEVFRAPEAPWLIASERGWIAGDNALVLLKGEVRIRREALGGSAPVAVDTRDLRVLPDEDFAETEAPTVIVTDQVHMAGTGMRAYLREGRLQILDKVRSRYEPKQPES